MGVKYFLLGYFFIYPAQGKMGAVCRLLFEASIPWRSDKKNRIRILEKYRKQAGSICSSTGSQISERVGLPQIIYSNRKKYGVFASLAVCLLLFLFSMGRVWDIRVTGAAEAVESEVLSALSEKGIKTGIRFRSFDFSETENSLKNACPSVAWVNAHRRGTVLYLHVIENEAGSKGEQAPLCNIVASEDCVITSVSPSSGVAMVKPGDSVRKGDLLISAVHPDGTLSGASGTVLGRVEGIVSGVCPREEKRLVSEKIGVKAVAINFFDFSFNIFKNYRNFEKDCVIIEETKQLRLFGRISLPFSACVLGVYANREQTVYHGDAEAVSLAGVRLKQAISDILSGGELESIRTAGSWTDEGYALQAEYVQIRNVCEIVPIHLEGEG